MIRRPLAALAAAIALVLASTAAAATPASPDDVELAQAFSGWMQRVFAVPVTPDLDTPLREAMTTIVTEHLYRLDALLPVWIAEARARSGAQATREDLVRQIRNRLVNEVALWRLDSPGPVYDALYLKAVLKPAMCYIPARASYVGRLMAWLQAVPPADRPALLAGERELLARWGQHRATLPARPARALSADENDAIAHLMAGDMAPDIAMPPVVADAVFAAERKEMHPDAVCALHQWGLARALRRGDPPAASLVAWRYEMAMTLDNWSDRPAQTAEEIKANNGWPTSALMSGMHGTVDVRVKTDAHGRFVSGEVVERRLEVPGIVDDRPVAFETALDTASLAKAAVEFKPTPPAPDGHLPTIRLNWTTR